MALFISSLLNSPSPSVSMAQFIACCKSASHLTSTSFNLFAMSFSTNTNVYSVMGDPCSSGLSQDTDSSPRCRSTNTGVAGLSGLQALVLNPSEVSLQGDQPTAF